MSEVISSRAQRLMNKVMGVWSPPLLSGSESEACIAQTSVMLAIAYIMGKEFLPCDLTDNQRAAIDDGLSSLSELIESDYQTLEQWMDRYEAAVESGQSNISRDEAEKRYHKKYGKQPRHQNGDW